MATIKRCDRCKEIYDRPGEVKEIVVKDYINPFLTTENERYFDLCNKCYSKLFVFENMEIPLDQMDEMLKED